jgi:hypothetical protein
MSTLMQKPDSARARPSTLLEEDDSYEKLFHKSNDLNTYFLVSFWGRSIEERLKKDKYTVSETSDIKFYVSYSSSCLMAKSLYPNSKIISGLTEKSLTDEIFNYSVEATYDLYRQLGGTDKVAKGTKLIDALKVKLREDKGLR